MAEQDLRAWLAEMVAPIGDEVVRLFNIASDGDRDEATAAEFELGRLVGALASRMYVYERVLEDLAEHDPRLRTSIAEMVKATPLPTF